MDAVAERMSGLTRDGTAEPVSRDQIIRKERNKKRIFPIQLITGGIGNLNLLPG